MKWDKICEFFKKNKDLKFDKNDIKLNESNDVHAMLILQKVMMYNPRKMVTWAGDDQIAFTGEQSDWEKLTEHQLMDLIKCGVYIEEGEWFGMYV